MCTTVRFLPALVTLATLSAAVACGRDEARRLEADARRARAEAEDAQAREQAAARREAQRLRDLWTYQETAPGPMHQRTAAISSVDDVDVDGSGARPVRLIFRDHDSWGRSSYLVLQAGDFDCYNRCTVRVTLDETAARPMAARRPRTDEAIAMFINDWQALWGAVRSARRVAIEFPVKAGGSRTAVFDVGGLDGSRMPGWDGAAVPSSAPGAGGRGPA